MGSLSSRRKKLVWFLRRFGLKTFIHFVHFGLESGIVFEGTTVVDEHICRLVPKEVSLAWRLDRETRRRLILHETGFTRYRFFTSYFIDVDTFYLFLN